TGDQGSYRVSQIAFLPGQTELILVAAGSARVLAGSKVPLRVFPMNGGALRCQILLPARTRAFRSRDPRAQFNRPLRSSEKIYFPRPLPAFDLFISLQKNRYCRMPEKSSEK